MLRTVIYVSSGTAAKLRLKKLKVLDLPTTAYLMIGEKCGNNCAFCIRSVESHNGFLSRIGWHKFDEDEVIKRINSSDLQRVCIQSTYFDGWVNIAVGLAQKITKKVSVSGYMEKRSDVDRLIDAGVDKVNISIDIVDDKIHEKLKGNSFNERKRLLMNATRKHPGKISTHIIIGLGERESVVKELISELHSNRISIGLFPFMPLKGTRLEGGVQPALDLYRRIQAFYFLQKENIKYLKDAFRTSGCPGCNRPYYTETPKLIYNYPRALTKQEAKEALHEAGCV